MLHIAAIGSQKHKNPFPLLLPTERELKKPHDGGLFIRADKTEILTDSCLMRLWDDYTCQAAPQLSYEKYSVEVSSLL